MAASEPSALYPRIGDDGGGGVIRTGFRTDRGAEILICTNDEGVYCGELHVVPGQSIEAAEKLLHAYLVDRERALDEPAPRPTGGHRLRRVAIASAAALIALAAWPYAISRAGADHGNAVVSPLTNGFAIEYQPTSTLVGEERLTLRGWYKSDRDFTMNPFDESTRFEVTLVRSDMGYVGSVSLPYGTTWAGFSIETDDGTRSDRNLGSLYHFVDGSFASSRTAIHAANVSILEGGGDVGRLAIMAAELTDAFPDNPEAWSIRAVYETAAHSAPGGWLGPELRRLHARYSAIEGSPGVRSIEALHSLASYAGDLDKAEFWLDAGRRDHPESRFVLGNHINALQGLAAQRAALDSVHALRGLDWDFLGIAESLAVADGDSVAARQWRERQEKGSER